MVSVLAPQVGLWSDGLSWGGASPLFFLPVPATPTSAFLFCPTEQNEIIKRKGCLPRAQCPLLGHTTYWSRSYALRHQCCEQDLCNAAPQRPLSLPLVTLLPLATIFGWGVHIFL